MRFIRNGEGAMPFAIRRIDIYRGFIRHSNLVGQIPFVDPSDSTYPFPAAQSTDDLSQYYVIFDAPETLVPDDIYFDVWHFIGDDHGSIDIDDESLWISQNGIFYLFDDVWLANDDLQTIRLGFEPLDKNFKRGEIRTIEVAIYPLPLYDHNWNLIAPLIPQLYPTMTVYTSYGELIDGLVDAPCTMGIR